ncbi:hypothetical protein SGRI78S_03010 [Streptomyces griseus subsp. griseus]
MPVGTSAPAWAPNTARSSTSAPSTTSTPASADAGMNAWCRTSPGIQVLSRRTTAGAHRPTKPTGPATATDTAASSTARMTAMLRVSRGLTPTTAAPSSPRARMSSRRPISISPANATSATGVSRSMDCMPIWASEPLPQANSPVVCWERRSSSIPLSPDRASVSAEPASTSRIGPAPARDRPRTTPAASSPPRKAVAPAGSAGSVMPNAATATTARYAPALTASVSGEASMLRDTDWRAAPAAPSAQPTSSPAASRGSRESRTTAAVCSSAVRSEAAPVANCQSVCRSTAAVPWPTCTIASAASATIPVIARRSIRPRRAGGPAATGGSAPAGPAAPAPVFTGAGGAVVVRVLIVRRSARRRGRRCTHASTRCRRTSRCRRAAGGPRRS